MNLDFLHDPIHGRTRFVTIEAQTAGEELFLSELNRAVKLEKFRLYLHIPGEEEVVCLKLNIKNEYIP